MGTVPRKYCRVGQIAKLKINMHKFYNALWHQEFLADVALADQNALIVYSQAKDINYMF
jgi:hypothetical protein